MKAYVSIAGVSEGDRGPAGAGVVVKDPCGKVVCAISQYLGVTTEAIAEYRALIAALREARKLNLRRIKIYTVSNVLQGQVKSRHPLISPRMMPLHQLARRLTEGFDWIDVVCVLPDKISEAKRLANEAIENCQVIQFPIERISQISA